MTATALEDTRRRSSNALLNRAVHRNRPATRDGFLERLFTLSFGGLVYPQIWEDPAIDLEAMEIAPHHHIVAIASGGCNILSYLTADPARITGVDLNRAHVALTRLKLAGLKSLPGWMDYYRFFGEADEAQNARDYKHLLRPSLDLETRRFWDGRTLSGRRRIGYFRRNIYTKGLLGRFIGVGHAAARFYGKNMQGLLDSRSIQEQRRFFNAEIAPLFEKPLVRWLVSRRASLFGLGIPPAQYEALAGGGRMANVLRQRLERLACGFPLSENYFAWQAFGRRYATGASGPLPPYLKCANFAKIRARADRASVHQVSLTEALEKMPSSSADRFVLLDAQDWMTDTQLNGLWRAITAVARPGARVIFRTAGTGTILPGRVDDATLGRWSYLAERSLELGHRDRSSIYGGFHVYELASHA